MLINCVAYQNGRKLADISIADISSYIARPDCFVWVGLKDPQPTELDAMRNEFGLHELAVEDAQHGHQRPKIEEYNGSLFVVLHLIELQNDELNVGEMAIFAGTKYVLSVRSRAERGFTDVRARCEREPELLRHGAGYVLYALMDGVVDRYFPALDSIESAIEDIEELIFADVAGDHLVHLAGFHQQADAEIRQPHVIGNNGQVLGAGAPQRGNQIFRDAAQPEAAHQNGRSVSDSRDDRLSVCNSLVHPGVFSSAERALSSSRRRTATVYCRSWRIL